ncbi:hypothetical protein DFH07DRAFT_861800 [Mycena maculata]|uniref:Uncharacterized protein n=1 Tax=Mycena maculata TaxID=230809 RepID=A0AAD7HC74_9AGAR|nr:hypothetical protein DFH07DRAFT_861800 [Mycena maculata]
MPFPSPNPFPANPMNPLAVPSKPIPSRVGLGGTPKGGVVLPGGGRPGRHGGTGTGASGESSHTCGAGSTGGAKGEGARSSRESEGVNALVPVPGPVLVLWLALAPVPALASVGELAPSVGLAGSLALAFEVSGISTSLPGPSISFASLSLTPSIGCGCDSRTSNTSSFTFTAPTPNPVSHGAPTPSPRSRTGELSGELCMGEFERLRLIGEFGGIGELGDDCDCDEDWTTPISISSSLPGAGDPPRWNVGVAPRAEVGFLLAGAGGFAFALVRVLPPPEFANGCARVVRRVTLPPPPPPSLLVPAGDVVVLLPLVLLLLRVRSCASSSSGDLDFDLRDARARARDGGEGALPLPLRVGVGWGSAGHRTLSLKRFRIPSSCRSGLLRFLVVLGISSSFCRSSQPSPRAVVTAERRREARSGFGVAVSCGADEGDAKRALRRGEPALLGLFILVLVLVLALATPLPLELTLSGLLVRCGIRVRCATLYY